MGQMFIDGGIWPVLVLGFGLVGLGLAGSMLSKKDGKDHTGLIVALVATTFFLGLGATAVGLYEAGNALQKVGPAEQPAMMARAIGIASSTTAFGALLAALDSLVLGIARALRARVA